MTIGLIDYGMGNLHSVQIAFRRFGVELHAVHHPSDLDCCDALILPGVGSFDPAMARLMATGLVPDLQRWHANDKPLLGICLGLQLLFDSSAEGSSAGLGLLPGRVETLPADQGERIPPHGLGQAAALHAITPVKPRARPGMDVFRAFLRCPSHRRFRAHCHGTVRTVASHSSRMEPQAWGLPISP